MKYIDLTHTFTSAMPVYPGDPRPEFVQISFLEKHGFNDFRITTGMHVGTHMDAPLHMLKNGRRLSEYPPERFFGRGHLLDARNRTIDVDLISKKISRGDFVFILTGFSKKIGTPDYYESYPEISEAFAARIVNLGVSLVGMDTPSPDRPPFAIHKFLLRNDVLIIENLTNLETLLRYEKFDVVALPAKFDTEGAPVRVIARI